MDKIKILEEENARLKSLIDIDDDSQKKQRIIEKLQSAENRLQSIQSIGKIGLWELFIDSKEFWGSWKAYHIFDLENPGDGMIDISSIKRFIHPEDKPLVESFFGSLIKQNTPDAVTFRIIIENADRARETKYVKLNGRFLSNSDSNNRKIAGTIQDVTDIKKHERDLLKSKEKAEESDRLKSAFLANMSHELRTPMNAIIGFSELLNIGEISHEKRKEYADIIKNKGSLLLTLIDDIIEVSKFESGHLNIHKSNTDLHHLLQELFTQHNQNKTQMGKETLEIKLSIPNKHPVSVYTDPGRLQQVLSNLLSNAIKFTEKGEIEFGYKQVDNKLEFFVKDTGIGISKEKQKDIFNRFRQIENTSSRHYAGGSGLGLTISKGIVELLGGKIWVESEPKKETIFYFTIPYEESKGSETLEAEENQQLNIKNFNWKNKVILVAEDEEVNYKFLETVLQDTQAKVIHAENGLQVIDLIKSINKIDLILMDIKMPVMNGYEATREVKKINPSIPVIAQTAFSMKDDKDKCEDAGCDDYVSKPIDIKALLIKINRLLYKK